MAEGAPRWVFTPEDIPAGEDFYAMGADLLPTTLLTAYASGVFPMPTSYAEGVPMGWWSPDPRGVLLPGDLRISRSLRRSLNKYTCTVDAAFDRVMRGCADPTRDGLWITAEVQAAYRELHRSGHAHSVEVWLDGDVVGGLYGVALGGFFAGESMYHSAPDASKVALVHLHRQIFGPATDRGDQLIDVQWQTPHLASLGVREIPRADYLARLPRAMTAPGPDWAAARR